MFLDRDANEYEQNNEQNATCAVSFILSQQIIEHVYVAGVIAFASTSSPQIGSIPAP